jgi:serine/threonine-protein kinase
VYALDAATGTPRWTHATNGLIRSSPAVVDGIVYIGSDDKKVYALDAATGQGAS